MEVLQRTANRGSISDGGYEVDNSAAFGGANGIQFNPSSDGNRKTWTISLWVKRSEIGVETTIFGATNTAIVFMSPDWFRFHLYTGSATYYYDTDNTDTVFRDTSAWYHIVFQCDTTQGVAANRTKLYINGALYTGARGGADTSANIPQNTEFSLNNNAVNFNVGYFYAGNEQLDGYLAEVNFTDGVANDADAFGEYDEDSGIWKPKAYAGSYGTNGFYLEFKESAASATGIGKDTSGNGHNFSTGGAYPSQATDTPTNNFATLNLQVPNYANTGGATDGGTKIPWSGVNSYGAFYATQAVKAGKWYWEFYVPSRSSSYGLMNYIGLHTMEELILTDPYRSEAMKNNVFWLMHYGDWYAHVNGSQSSQNTVAGLSSRGAEAAGRTYAIAFNADDAEITYYENGTRISNLEFDIFDLDERMAAGTFVVPWFQVYHNDLNVNFGGYSSIAISSGNTDANGYGNFEYAPPTGYYALCTKNLAEFG